MNGEHIGSKPLALRCAPTITMTAVEEEVAMGLVAATKGSQTCLSSCRDEVLRVPTTKK